MRLQTVKRLFEPSRGSGVTLGAKKIDIPTPNKPDLFHCE